MRFWSKRELEYLQNPVKYKKKHGDNAEYQIKHLINRKIKEFRNHLKTMYNGIELILSNPDFEKNLTIKDTNNLQRLLVKIFKNANLDAIDGLLKAIQIGINKNKKVKDTIIIKQEILVKDRKMASLLFYDE